MADVWVITPGRIARLFRRCEGPCCLQCHGYWRQLQHIFLPKRVNRHDFVRHCNPENYHLKVRQVTVVDCVLNVMARAQKPHFVFRRNGRVHLNRQGRQFSRLLAGELCTSACSVCTARASLYSAVMWRLLVTHSILLFPLHFSSRASPCAITFLSQSTFRYSEVQMFPPVKRLPV
jgi:hypothetical protein